MDSANKLAWLPFACDGRSFEYAVGNSKQRTRPANWPSHKASPGRSVPVVLVFVRRAGAESGPGMVYPDGTVATIEHALETARFFRDELA